MLSRVWISEVHLKRLFNQVILRPICSVKSCVKSVESVGQELSTSYTVAIKPDPEANKPLVSLEGPTSLDRHKRRLSSTVEGVYILKKRREFANIRIFIMYWFLKYKAGSGSHAQTHPTLKFIPRLDASPP